MNPFIEMRNITKVFPGVIANDDVCFSLSRGEIRAVVGENGAGKTTLMKILYGMYIPDEGEILLDGCVQNIRSSHDAIRLGIGMIHQHFMLIPTLTALENIILGVAPRKYLFFIDTESARTKIQSLMDHFNLSVPLNVKVQDLSVGDRQRIEILKELYRDVNILILDEPTAILTPQEADGLFKVMREFANAGKTIVFISHKLREVMAVAESITVMRKGKVVGNTKALDVTKHDIAKMMVGREVMFKVEKEPAQPGEIVLKVDNLNVLNRRTLPAVCDVSFNVRAKEIVGIAGVEGNGQFELVECLTGMWPSQKGNALFENENILITNVFSLRELGIAHIPEDRLVTGLCKEMTLWENLLMGFHKKFPFVKFNGLKLNSSYITKFAEECVEKYSIKIPDIKHLLKTLSGGNLQKAVLAREISHDPKLLIVSQPTRGVDMGAIEFIHKQIVFLRDKGCAILLVSADLQELMNLSDRILVMYEGEIIGELASEEFDEQKIGYLMAGLQSKEKI